MQRIIIFLFLAVFTQSCLSVVADQHKRMGNNKRFIHKFSEEAFGTPRPKADSIFLEEITFEHIKTIRAKNPYTLVVTYVPYCEPIIDDLLQIMLREKQLRQKGVAIIYVSPIYDFGTNKSLFLDAEYSYRLYVLDNAIYGNKYAKKHNSFVKQLHPKGSKSDLLPWFLTFLFNQKGELLFLNKNTKHIQDNIKYILQEIDKKVTPE